MADFQDLTAKPAVGARVSSRPGLTAPDVQRILRFFSRVTLVVDQALEDVLALSIDLSYIRASGLAENRIIDFQREMDVLVFRRHYHDMEEICSRLRMLRQQYEVQIRPLLRDVSTAEWADLCSLIDEMGVV